MTSQGVKTSQCLLESLEANMLDHLSQEEEDLDEKMKVTRLENTASQGVKTLQCLQLNQVKIGEEG